MKAARLHEGRTDFAVEDVPAPEAGPGTVVVRIEHAFLPTYIAALAEGVFAYTPPRPFTAGHCAIGVVESAGAGVEPAIAGRRVYCDLYLESQGVDAPGDAAFIGCFGPEPAAGTLLERWRNGTFAERVLLPRECVVPVPEDIGVAPEVLCRLGWLGTAWQGLVRGGLEPGGRVAITGASGVLGTSAVLAALAMGAGRVEVHGRRPAILARLHLLDYRVVAADDTADVDLVLDCTDGAPPDHLAALLHRLARGGSAVVLGALSRPLPVDTDILMPRDLGVRGSFWFPRDVPARILRLVAAGALDLTAVQAEVYPLARINEAVERSLEASGGLRHVALDCSG